MSTSPPTVPARVPSRSIMLASFAGGGMLLAGLLLVLIGCGTLLSLPDEVDDPVKNAVLCECDCDPPSAPVAVPFKNFITVGPDDASKSRIDGSQIVLGESTVGLRFQQVGVPPLATITSARIQFTPAAASSGSATLRIHMVDQPDAQPFGPPLVDLDGLPLIGTHVDWTVDPWNPQNDKPDFKPELTPELKDLLQAIVNDDKYTPLSAVAFIIKTGSGRRTAAAFESGNLDPAFLHVDYVPHKSHQEFVTCADPADTADPVKAAAFCTGTVKDTVSHLAQQCRLANACVCKLKEADATRFSGVCAQTPPCAPLAAPADCDRSGLAVATHAKDQPADKPVCVANSPLGSLLTGRLSACDLDEASSKVFVQVRDEDGKNPHSAQNTARGRVQFVGTPCPDDPVGCSVGMNHRINVKDLQFEDALSDHRLTDVAGVGEDTSGAFVFKSSGKGIFDTNKTKHSVRGTDIAKTDGGTKGFFGPNSLPLTISVGNWTSNAVCSMGGTLIEQKQVTLNVDLQGKLVNQPPKAVGFLEDLDGTRPLDGKTIECSQTGGATFNLNGSQSSDPDNNIVSITWHKGNRTGDIIGNLLRAQYTQLVSTPASNHETPYVIKVIDAFGQYDDATTTVNVVDTTAPHVSAPADVTAECTGPSGQAVTLGTATATDVCDASPDLTNDAPALFKVGPATIVTWTATDESLNKGTATQTVKIVDTTAPKLTVTLSPTVLWPPDHKLIPITATISVSDICDPNPTVQLVSIKSNEPDNGLGDGDTEKDIQQADFGKDDRTFLLRAERSGKGNGRIYTVTYQATDASGNSTIKTATVTVPKNQAAGN